MKKLLKKIIPDFLLSRYHWKLALLGALVYGWPSRKLKVIGVTGTKGKSTVVMLAGKVLESAKGDNPPTPLLKGGAEGLNPSQPSFYKGGSNVGWISSLTINDGKKEVMNPYHMTMPGRFFIQKTLARMVRNGCEYALIEVTSEGIKQHRHRFIKWAGAVFTNLASEHLETHGGFANYRSAKLKLFEAAAKNPESFGVYNLDDENAEWFLRAGIKNKIVYGKSLRGVPPWRGDAAIPRDCFASLAMTNIKSDANGSEFEIDGVKFRTNLLGEFNVYNCVAAIGVGVACGVGLETAARVLEKIKSIPGRLEIIDEGQDFTVVVDLAHTPDSFEKVFKIFRELPHNRIVSVFGSAGGGRDKWKRPELGKIASANSDQVIICNEDPYDEDPLAIADDILAGCDKNKADIVLDRRQAIARALSLARSGDIVLILGKGTEQSLVIGSKKYPWDDREVVKEEIRNLKIKMQNEK
jgi:UDP-N-acetylmuramoyl-L-alanyl-D-glutamate--2,6-diaminopimelate ligase